MTPTRAREFLALCAWFRSIGCHIGMRWRLMKNIDRAIIQWSGRHRNYSIQAERTVNIVWWNLGLFEWWMTGEWKVNERWMNGDWMVNDWWMKGGWMVDEWWMNECCNTTEYLTEAPPLLVSDLNFSDLKFRNGWGLFISDWLVKIISLAMIEWW